MSRGKRDINFYRYQIKDTIRKTGSVTCGICLKQVTKVDDVNVDHILPRSRGGDSRFGNLQPAHRKCNTKKGSKIWDTENTDTTIRQKTMKNQKNRGIIRAWEK